MDLVRFNDLLQKYKDGRLSQQEWNELRQAVLTNNFDSVIQEEVLHLLQQMHTHTRWTPNAEEEVWNRIIQNREQAVLPQISFRREHRIKYSWWAAAASVAVLLTAGVYYFSNRAPQLPIVKAESTKKIQDIAPPGTSQAYITLANGQQVLLDNAGAGTLATQGNIAVVKNADGQITYSGSTGEVMYNNLFNPRGSKVINLALSDGTRIWLNSESSLRFPTVFTGKERRVEVIGEAYFEVAHNASMPFIVKNVSRGTEIRVLGTHFNVNAYNDEPDMKVTLLEGSVKVKSESPAKGTPFHGNPSGSEKVRKSGRNEVVLQPGEQARLGEIRESIRVIRDIDVEEVMAWKNGKFQFGEATDIPAVLRQISRWYNVEIECKRPVDGHIGGTISRNVNASEVFKMLEMTGSIKFQIDGKKIIVMP